MISNKFLAFAILAMVANVSTRPVDLGQDQSTLTSSLATPTESVVIVTSTRTIATGTPSLSTPSTVNTPAPTSVIPAWMDWATYVLSHPSGYIPPTYILPVPTLGAATSATSDLARYLPTEAAPEPVPTASTAPSPRVDVVSDSHIPNSTGLPTTESPLAVTAVETATSALPAASTTALPESAPSVSAPAAVNNAPAVSQPSAPAASASSLPASMSSATASVPSGPAASVTLSSIPGAPSRSAITTASASS
ncbi:hypothetical protein C8Q80DRAFT_1265752 [Daedaleopsis nitida]|nr:hypothetical protein C8Q80DRAFT_1265752 [Daedaleopsis nitida]